MHILTVALSGCLLAATASAQRADGQFWPCNPIKNDTGACPADPGLPTSTYSVDFTKKTSIPTNWMISNYANIPFGPLGAEFTYAKRYDAPQLWTDFFILFGKITIEARIANGTGMISSFVLISDDFDEIDFEFSGNNFGDTASRGKGQNNYFGKGITGNYDRGGWFDVVDPQGTFHTYEIEWTEERLVWRVDGVEVRRFLARDATTAKDSAYQFPQTPSKFQLGIWAGGDPGQNEGTKAWAGGETNISAAPYTMYVKNVKIENYKPAWAYNWSDQSGTWQSIQLLKQPLGDADEDEGNSTITPPSMEMNSTDPENDGLEGGVGGGSSATLPLTSSSSSSSSNVKPSTSVTTSRTATTSTTTKPSSSSSTTKPASSTTKPTSAPSSSRPASSSTPKTGNTKPSSSSTTKSTSSIATSKTTATPKITTTKYTTTTTSCKTTSTPKPATTKTQQQWQWGSWGSWWRNDENDPDDGNWNWQQRQRGGW